MRSIWSFKKFGLDMPYNRYSMNYDRLLDAGQGNRYITYCGSFCPLLKGDACTLWSHMFSSCANYSVHDANSPEHWFKDWHGSRANKLTASTFAGAVGFWRRRRVQLWLEKIGAIEPFTNNAATLWSNSQEKVALERYMCITGNFITLPAFEDYSKTNPDEGWLAASADGLIQHTANGLLYDGVLEIKCPFFAGEVTKASPWSRFPMYYMPQAQGLLAILDKQWMDFYCWTPNGSSLFRVERNPVYWSILKTALLDFWCNHVCPAQEICSMYPIEDPIRELSLLRPAEKHELHKYIVHASIQLADDSKLLVREIHGRLLNN